MIIIIGGVEPCTTAAANTAKKREEVHQKEGQKATPNTKKKNIQGSYSRLAE